MSGTDLAYAATRRQRGGRRCPTDHPTRSMIDHVVLTHHVRCYQGSDRSEDDTVRRGDTAGTRDTEALPSLLPVAGKQEEALLISAAITSLITSVHQSPLSPDMAFQQLPSVQSVADHVGVAPDGVAPAGVASERVASGLAHTSSAPKTWVKQFRRKGSRYISLRVGPTAASSDTWVWWYGDRSVWDGLTVRLLLDFDITGERRYLPTARAS
eukprot:2141644-Rhodomonas_salina.2